MMMIDVWLPTILNHHPQPPPSTTTLNHHPQPPSSTTILNHHPQPPSSTIILNHHTLGQGYPPPGSCMTFTGLLPPWILHDFDRATPWILHMLRQCHSHTVALYLMHSSQKRLAENFRRTTVVAPHAIVALTPRIPPLLWYSGNTQYSTSEGDTLRAISQPEHMRKNLQWEIINQPQTITGLTSSMSF
jgi:hypothetical protein